MLGVLAASLALTQEQISLRRRGFRPLSTPSSGIKFLVPDEVLCEHLHDKGKIQFAWPTPDNRSLSSDEVAQLRKAVLSDQEACLFITGPRQFVDHFWDDPPPTYESIKRKQVGLTS